MDNASYESALRSVADSYEQATAEAGRGKSLSRIATIVLSSGAFFIRLREGSTFSARNLDKLADWFRRPRNWPAETIPHDAVLALTSIGRPPLDDAIRHEYRTVRHAVAFETQPVSHGTLL